MSVSEKAKGKHVTETYDLLGTRFPEILANSFILFTRRRHDSFSKNTVLLVRVNYSLDAGDACWLKSKARIEASRLGGLDKLHQRVVSLVDLYFLVFFFFPRKYVKKLNCSIKRCLVRSSLRLQRLYVASIST
jgi:hypothetical protein